MASRKLGINLRISSSVHQRATGAVTVFVKLKAERMAGSADTYVIYRVKTIRVTAWRSI
jgi:hypothetical protein